MCVSGVCRCPVVCRRDHKRPVGAALGAVQDRALHNAARWQAGSMPPAGYLSAPPPIAAPRASRNCERVADASCTPDRGARAPAARDHHRLERSGGGCRLGHGVASGQEPDDASARRRHSYRRRFDALQRPGVESGAVDPEQGISDGTQRLAARHRRGGRAADCTGLENRSVSKDTQGSNPCLSACSFDAE